MHHHYAYDEEERSGEEYADEFDSAFDQFTHEYAPMSPFDTAEDEFGCIQEGICEDAAAGAKDSSLNFAGHGVKPYQRAEEYLVSLLEELRVMMTRTEQLPDQHPIKIVYDYINNERDKPSSCDQTWLHKLSMNCATLRRGRFR